METALDAFNEGVIIATDRHRILFVNSRFVEMTGISGQDLIDFHPSRSYSSQERDFLNQQLDIAFQAGRNRYARNPHIYIYKDTAGHPAKDASKWFSRRFDRYPSQKTARSGLEYRRSL